MDNNEYLGNKYLLTMMVAKRAKQLNQGSKPLIETNEKNTRVTALKEIVEGKVYPKDRIQDQGQDED